MASSSQSPYILSTAPGVITKAILTVGDTADNGYKMVGIPDGLGAYDNGDGTFTLLMNHELGNTVGVTRASGGKGAFISSWVIRKSDLSVISGGDLIQKVYNWDATNQKSSTTNSIIDFNRFCSADLPELTAFYNPLTGLGTTERLFMNGEEGSATGFALTTVATGANKGNTYVLGKFDLSTNGSGLTGVGAWENLLANPFVQNKTVVIGNNDGGTGIMNNSVAVYVGTKTNTGTEADKAGLTNGTLKFVNVTGNAVEITDATTRATGITDGTRFTLSATASTTFSRPEDGAWNPLNPKEYFFVTTDRLDQVADGIGTQVGRSRLWRLTFDDITNPDAGGKIDLLLDGTEGQNMFDNITVDKYGHITLLEDVGNAAHSGKIWQYDIASDKLTQLAKFDSARFGDIGVASTAPFTIDEESSGVIDVQNILGPGWFLVDAQAHFPTTGELVEGGQLLALYNPTTFDSYKNSNKLFKSSEDVINLTAVTTDEAKLKVTVTKAATNLMYEVGVFTVDNEIGAINGVLPTDAGYAKAALERSKVILSGISNLPNGFTQGANDLTRLLQLSPNQNLRFYELANPRTTDDINRNGVGSDLQFSTVSKVSDLGKSGFSIDFKDLSISITTSADSLLLGTALQGNKEGEVLDLRGTTGNVKADFTVNREASFNNFVGFYKVDDETGRIGSIKTTDAGYANAAINARVTGIDLQVANQGTASFADKQFTGGSIFAPFLIVNGNVDQALNGQAQVYFAYLGANSDKVDHVRLLGNNTFGFEDLAGGGDRDYNDVIVTAKLTKV
jgi:hypothetical protein